MSDGPASGQNPDIQNITGMVELHLSHSPTLPLESHPREAMSYRDIYPFEWGRMDKLSQPPAGPKEILSTRNPCFTQQAHYLAHRAPRFGPQGKTGNDSTLYFTNEMRAGKTCIDERHPSGPITSSEGPGNDIAKLLILVFLNF